MKNRLLFTTLGLLLVVASTLLVLRGLSLTSILASSAASASQTQALTLAANQASALQSSSSQLVGNYSGNVKLQFSVDGVYSDTITPPSPSELAALPDMGVIDLALQMTQSANALSGYVDLAKTLVFSVEHIITSISSTQEIGPYIYGSINGLTITLESEKVALVVSDQRIQRQFRMIGTLDPTDSSNFSGEYRETLWGYVEQPITIIGQFKLKSPVFDVIAAETINNLPLLSADIVSTTPGVSLIVSVLANDIDPDGDLLTITSVSKPQFGTVSTNGTNVTYQPNVNFVGADSFTYQVSDGKGASAGGVVSVLVQTASGPNQAPLAMSDSISTTSGVAITIDVLTNDSDPNGDPLTITIETASQHGEAIVQNGQILYTPTAGFVGTDTITYRVSDGKGGSATATITITVTTGQVAKISVYLPLVNR